MGSEIPLLTFSLRMLAAGVAYTRVHSGVHYPGDALIGVMVGEAMGSVVNDLIS